MKRQGVRTCAIALVGLAFGSQAASMTSFCITSFVSLTEVAAYADFAVVGVLSNIHEIREGDYYVTKGTLNIERTVFGSWPRADTLRVRWRNHIDFDCPSIDHDHQQGIRAVWLLKAREDGWAAAASQRSVIPLRPAEITQATCEIVRTMVWSGWNANAHALYWHLDEEERAMIATGHPRMRCSANSRS